MEVEAKFIIQDTQTYQELQGMERLGCFSISAPRVEDLRDTYLDTPDRRLLRSGYACRQREQDGCAVIALKSLHGAEGNVHRREEVEAPLARVEIPPEQWPDSAARQRVLALIDPLMRLQPLLHLEQRRVVREVLYAQRLVAELSLDTVKSYDQVYHELEVELKGVGTEYDLAAILDKLTQLPGLKPESRSKFERALAALDAQDTPPPARTKSAPTDAAASVDRPGIVASDSMAEAARKTLRFHMLRMLASEAGTRAGVNIEALHDMRVAIRRMRTAFFVLADAIDAEVTAPYLKELKHAGRVLGRVRDMDVFREKAQAYLGAFAKSTPPDLTLLMSAWDAEYARARSKLLKYLDSERYARFKEAFAAYLEIPMPPSANSPSPRVAIAVPDLIATRLVEFYTSKSRLDQADADLTDYHRMRIVTKYLRYTLEYFREVLGSEVEQAIGELKVLQDHLGALQDAVVACAHLHNVISWGTWQRPTEEQLRWTPTPINAPDVAAYLEFRQTESRRLVRTFPEAWA
ncbi:MAG TPA: CHAD domain-containing protein, partial [Candidatus Omnitrophota bacterium]|nr:CHAD domain-containing protein [Candidatus Omnitrophota bacterium]